MFMMPIRSPGVTVTPIKLVTGGSHFCQEFFDDVQLHRGPAHRRGERRLAGRLQAAVPRAQHDRRQQPERPRSAGGRDDGEGDAISELIALAKAVGPQRRQLHPAAHRRGGDPADAARGPTISRINAAAGRRAGCRSQAASILRLMAGLYGSTGSRRSRMEIAGTQGVMHGAAMTASARYGQRWLGARIGTIAGGSHGDAAQRDQRARPRAAPRGDPRPRRAVQRGAGQPPSGRLISWPARPPGGPDCPEPPSALE